MAQKDKLEDLHKDISSGYKEPDMEYVFNKLMRLSSVVHMVTQDLAGEEPLRIRMRQLSVGILDGLSRAREKSYLKSQYVLCDLKIDLHNLGSLVKLAGMSFVLSPMNCQIMSDELDGLAEKMFARNQIKGRDGMTDLGSLPVKAEEGSDIVSTENIKDAAVPKGHIDTSKNAHAVTPPKPETHRVSSPSLGSGVKDRHGRIINYIKASGTSTASEIAKAVGGTSEKTIQRDLLRMVENDVLKKEGKRRWTRYFL